MLTVCRYKKKVMQCSGKHTPVLALLTHVANIKYNICIYLNIRVKWFGAACCNTLIISELQNNKKVNEPFECISYKTVTAQTLRFRSANRARSVFPNSSLVFTCPTNVACDVCADLDPRRNTCISWMSSWKWSGAPCSSFSMRFPIWTLEETQEGSRATLTSEESYPCSTAYCGKSWASLAR